METISNLRVSGSTPRIYPLDRRPVRALARLFSCRGRCIVVHLELVGGSPGKWTYMMSVSRTLVEQRESIAMIRVCSTELAKDDVEMFFIRLGVIPCDRWRHQ